MPDPILKKPFLLGQQLKELTGVKPADLKYHLFGEEAKKAPSERDREREPKDDPWKPIDSRDDLIREASLAAPPRKRVGLVCDAGLGKTTNLEWLEAKIAGASNGQQLPYLLKLYDTRKNQLDLDLVAEELDHPGAILKSLAWRIAGMGSVDQDRLYHALFRYQKQGRITLLLDGLDHAMSRENIAGIIGRLTRMPLWENCPIWISGRPYAFEDCWEEVFEKQRPHEWHYLRVEPLAIPDIQRYMVKQTGGDWSRVFDAAAWNLLAIPRMLLLICDLIRRKIDAARPTNQSEKEAIVRGLNFQTAADVYYRAYFDPEYPKERNKRRLLGQGVDTTNDYGIAISGYKTESLNEFNYPKRIERAGIVLGAIAFELFTRKSSKDKMEPTTSAVEVCEIEEPVGNRLIEAKQGDAGALERDLDILQRMNNFSLDFLVFREAGSKHLRFYDRTVEAFFAAYWAMKFGTPEDRALLKNWIIDKGGKRLGGFNEFWQFAAEMPDQLIDKPRWLEVFGPCYAEPKGLAEKQDEEVQWCRQMIYHSYARMEMRSVGTIWSWRDRWLELEHGKGTRKQRKIFNAITGGFRHCPKDVALTGIQRYQMGSPESEEDRFSDEEQRWVEVRPFLMHEFAVTNEQYELFDPEHGKRRDQYSKDDKQPVLYVGFWDAWCFAKWCGYRLPTEEEWEYACRAGTATPFFFEEGINQTNCNFNFNVGRTTPKNEDHMNDWLLCDMHGNVLEWCDSRYEPGASARVLRGGGWHYDARDCRSAFRYYDVPDYRSDFIGFRLAAVPRVGAKPSVEGASPA